jgi:excisionase family DNA binding protein
MKTITAPKGALKIKDAAEYLGGISQITVRRLIKRGLIRPNRALRHILVSVEELDRFINLGESRKLTKPLKVIEQGAKELCK